MLTVTPVRAFADNYLWLAHAPREARKVVAIDPGDAQAIQDTLQRQQLSLAAILVTHHHADHVGGLNELVKRFDVPVFGPAGEAMPVTVQPLRDGDLVALDALGLRFDVLDVPGHTVGHIAFAGHGVVFCGDTLFSAGCGRLFEGTAAQMYRSLAKLKALDEHTRVYCAHEYTLANLMFAAAVEPRNPDVQQHLRHCRALRANNQPTVPSTISLERKINPFLRCEFGTVKQAAEQWAGRTIDSETAIFAALRSWKDGFRA